MPQCKCYRCRLSLASQWGLPSSSFGILLLKNCDINNFITQWHSSPVYPVYGIESDIGKNNNGGLPKPLPLNHQRYGKPRTSRGLTRKPSNSSYNYETIKVFFSNQVNSENRVRLWPNLTHVSKYQQIQNFLKIYQ